MLSLEEIRKIAQLARINLTPAEEKRFAETISAVLDYMKILNEVDTAGVAPTAQVTGLQDVVRLDEPRTCAARAQLINSFPDKKGDELRVPGVF